MLLIEDGKFMIEDGPFSTIARVIRKSFVFKVGFCTTFDIAHRISFSTKNWQLYSIFNWKIMLRQSNSINQNTQNLPVLRKSAQRLSENLVGFRRIEGGLSGVTREVILKFICFCENAKEGTKIAKEWLPSICEFENLISRDPALRLHWQAGIEKSGATLKRYQSRQVLDIMDSAVKLGPKFSHSELVGFPLNSIFIEFMQNENGRAFFSSEKVNQAFKAILNDYGKMLDSKESLRYMHSSQGGWFSQEARKAINYEQYDCDPQLPHYGFKNWNQWFLRRFKQGQRVVGANAPKNVKPQNVITNACESTPLSAPLQPYKNVKLTDKFWLKDSCYSLTDMFGAKKHKKEHLAKIFEGGTVYQAFLSALNYHRWHSPVDGVVTDIYNIEGTYLFDQSQFLGEFDQGSPNNSQSFLSAVAARQVFIIQSDNPLIGKLAIILIGMAEVSSCVSIVQIGDKVQKGQQIGYFAYGGSSHTIIFQKKAKLQFSSNLYETTKDGKKKNQQQLVNSFLAYVQQAQ